MYLRTEKNPPEVVVFLAMLAAATSITVFATIYISITSGRFAIGLSPFILIYSFVHAFAFGLPSYFICKKMKWTQWWVSPITGFIIGILPFTLWLWPTKNKSTMTKDESGNWIPMPPDWSGFFDFLWNAGALGAIGGISAWIVWKLMTRPHNQQET